MRFRFELEGQALIAELQGELDLHTSPEFKANLVKLFDTHPHIKHLIMHVKGLSFVDSSGLGVILGRYRELQQRGGRLFFCAAQSSDQAHSGNVGLSEDIGICRFHLRSFETDLRRRLR